MGERSERGPNPVLRDLHYRHEDGGGVDKRGGGRLRRDLDPSSSFAEESSSVSLGTSSVTTRISSSSGKESRRRSRRGERRGDQGGWSEFHSSPACWQERDSRRSPREGRGGEERTRRERGEGTGERERSAFQQGVQRKEEDNENRGEEREAGGGVKETKDSS